MNSSFEPTTHTGATTPPEEVSRLERKISELRGWVLLLVGMDTVLFVMVLILLIR